MKKKLTYLALICSMPLHAGTMGEQQPLNYSWFASIGAGYSWTQLPGIVNPNLADWDFSDQGYDSSLGNRGFYTLEVGKQVHRYIDVSLLYLDHETFNYQMFQTNSLSQSGLAGSARNRYFNLNNRGLLVNGFLHLDHSWYDMFTVGFTPFIGGGIGYALNQVTNFYNVGSTDVNGTAIGSITSVGNHVNTSSFAWQASAGLNIKPELNHLSFDLGYRYYDGGHFNTSTSIHSYVSGTVPVTPWSGEVKANQLFVDIKYTV